MYFRQDDDFMLGFNNPSFNNVSKSVRIRRLQKQDDMRFERTKVGVGDDGDVTVTKRYTSK